MYMSETSNLRTHKGLSGVLAGLLSISLALGSSAAISNQASAAEIDPTSVSETTTLTAQEQKELADNLKVLFTRYIPLVNGKFTVNKSAVAADGLQSKLTDFEHTALMFNAFNEGVKDENAGLYGTSAISNSQWWNFAKCVLGNAIGVGIGTSPNLIRAVITGIKAWNWGLTAASVARIVGPLALKGVGGVAGLAAALGVAAWSCRSKL